MNQRMLDAVVGQNGKIRHLGAGAGGGGDGSQRNRFSGKIDHSLGAIHGAAAAQCHHQIRCERLQKGCTPGHQLGCGVRHDLVKNFPGFRRCLGNFPGGPSLGKKLIRDQEDPFGSPIFQTPPGSGPGNDFGSTGKCLQGYHRFLPGLSEVVFPGQGKTCGRFPNCIRHFAGKIWKAVDTGEKV